MRLIRGLHNLDSAQKQFASGAVVSIGNFDGVHLGHQQILQRVVEKAQSLKLPSVVMLFEPLPVEFFAPEKAPVRLMNLREKLQAFESTQIDYVVCVRFNQQFAELSAQAFVEQILLDKLNTKHLVVGDDFRFGKNRLGDFAYLQQQGLASGFTVSDMASFDVAGERVSSTLVRAALAEPDLKRAEQLLGKDFKFNGRVIHGQKLGRTIGFKTLNLNPKRLQMPVQGVFAVEVDGIADKPWLGVANVGLRPTVEGLRPSIEVHLFDWDRDVYGQHVDVILEHYIRPEMKFDGLESLKKQIEKDAQAAREFFAMRVSA